MSGEENVNSSFLMARMLEGWDWFDGRLREALLKQGYRSFSKTQSMLIVYVASGVERPSEIARRMNLSRQAVLYVAHELVDARILEIHPAAEDRRAFRLAFSAQMDEVRDFAVRVLRELEERLERKLGNQNLKLFRELHALAWKEPGSKA